MKISIAYSGSLLLIKLITSPPAGETAIIFTAQRIASTFTMPTALCRAIVLEQWNRAIHLAESYPHQVQVWSKHDGLFDGIIAATVLPLHQALVLNAPFEVIVALVKCYPQALQQCESSYERLPLHCACRKTADLATIQYLVEQYPEACLVPDALQRLPLHYALTNRANPAVAGHLLETQPKAASSRDIRGFMPLHVACATGAPSELVRTILEAFPEAAWTFTESGFSAQQCIPRQCPHASELIRLVDREAASSRNLVICRSNHNNQNQFQSTLVHA